MSGEQPYPELATQGDLARLLAHYDAAVDTGGELARNPTLYRAGETISPPRASISTVTLFAGRVTIAAPARTAPYAGLPRAPALAANKA
ncbi:MAG TPA: hypothetical protein VF930_05845 [Stellaceae bacterium]